jgi:hypothetical protein
LYKKNQDCKLKLQKKFSMAHVSHTRIEHNLSRRLASASWSFKFAYLLCSNWNQKDVC